MPIYSTNYRKIYEQHHGPIPVDEDGRTYDIHHIDGNRANNDIINLAAHPIKEHYDIHYGQEDYGACHAILLRMSISPEDFSDIARLHQLKRIETGEHHWLSNNPSVIKINDGTHHWLTEEHKERTRQIQYERLDSGNHPFIGGEVSRKTNKKRVDNGTHNFLMSETRKIVDEKRSDTWEITFPDGETIVRKNLKSFCKENDLNQGAMNQVGLGRILHHKGFKCKKLKKGEIRGKEAK